MSSPKTEAPLSIWVAYNDASNAGDHDTAARCVDPALNVFVNGRPAIASVDEDRAIQVELIRCYPDYERQYVAGFECGAWATIEWRMRGTAEGRSNLPSLDVPGCSIVRCAQGRIVEARLYHPTGALDRVADRALGRR